MYASSLDNILRVTLLSLNVPSKQTIQDSFIGASTRRTYSTYQRQFEAYCISTKHGLQPESATSDDCTDFFHHLYSLGRKARTIDSAKTALVAYFKDKNIVPNPAQASQSKQYVVGLQKYNRQNNVDEEKKAHPLSIDELSTLMNSFAKFNPFVSTMLRFLFSCCYLGCFRIGEVLALKWYDVVLHKADTGDFVSVRLRWHKKASVEKECQIYHIVNEDSYPCLRVCAFYGDYMEKVKLTIMNIPKNANVFPQLSWLQHGNVSVNWLKPMEQNQLIKLVNEIIDETPSLPIGISLHSMCRGGCFYRVFHSSERRFDFRELLAWCRWTNAKTCCFYRVFQSLERRFDFRELMAWCRWTDAKTCCEYLVTKSISDAIDPRNLLQKQKWSSSGVHDSGGYSSLTPEIIAKAVMDCLRSEKILKPVAVIAEKRQKTMIDYAISKSIPTARCGADAWNQWFSTDPKNGVFCALKNYTKDMIKQDRRKYSERQTLALAFNKYQSFVQFENEYAGYTKTYSGLLQEVRKRKRENRM